MPMTARSRSLANLWPFWLLVAGWLCAQQPQLVVYDLLRSISESRHYSHQHRLSMEIAFAMAGKVPPKAIARATGQPHHAPLPVPTDTAPKKLELVLVPEIALLPPILRATTRLSVATRLQPWFRAAPPHEPPRAA